MKYLSTKENVGRNADKLSGKIGFLSGEMSGNFDTTGAWEPCFSLKLYGLQVLHNFFLILRVYTYCLKNV